MKGVEGIENPGTRADKRAELEMARDAAERAQPIIEGARDLLFDSLGAPRPGLSDGQAYCIASLLDIEAERIHDAVGLLTACIDATKE